MTDFMKNFFITLAVISFMGFGCSKKSSGSSSSGNTPNAEDQRKTGESFGDITDLNIGDPELEVSQDEIRDAFEEQFPGEDFDALVSGDDSEIVDQLADMGFGTDSIVSMLGDHFDLGDGTDVDSLTSLFGNDGDELTTDQLTELLQEQYPDLNIDEAFALPDMGGDDSIVTQLMDAGGDQASLIDILIGQFQGTN